MKPFDYLKPGSMNDAIGALKEHDHPVLLAGGTDLLVAMKASSSIGKVTT